MVKFAHRIDICIIFRAKKTKKMVYRSFFVGGGGSQYGTVYSVRGGGGARGFPPIFITFFKEGGKKTER